MSTPPAPDLSALSPLASELASTIARVSSDIALVIDSDGVISTVAEGSSALGPASGSWVGQRWVDTASSSTRKKIQLLLDEATAGGVARRREVSHPGGQGDEIPVAWSAIRLGAGGPVLAVGRDLRAVAAIQQRFIEAQQDMERQYWTRRQAETRYQQLFQVASDAVLVVDAVTLQVLDANGAVPALLGVQVDAVAGCALTDLLPASIRAAVGELLLGARTSGRAGEIRVRAAAGEPALDISATPFRAGDQHQMLVRARRDTLFDADSRAMARMAEFVELTPDAVVITDSAGAILMANPAFLRLARQTDEAQVRGKPLPQLLFDAHGGWARLIARTCTHGIVPNAMLEVGTAETRLGSAARGHTLSVQVAAALMPEGEQTCLGFLLRPHLAARVAPAAAELIDDLLDQVGRVPLADLLAEVGHRAERLLIGEALVRTGGVPGVAADALGLTPEALALRMKRHRLAAPGPDDTDDGSQPPRTIN